MSDITSHKPRDLNLAFVKYERWWYMNRQPKLSLHFTIIDFGEDFGKPIQAHYRLDRFDKRGRCYAKPRTRIVRDLGRLFPDYIDQVPLPLSRLKGCTMVGRTRWVTKDGNNVDLAPQQHYELVECLLGLANGQQS
ncbi:MAG: hypothetical protein IID59_11065 [Proteobacteria bacterium]|nr:hypothetical protein [Pseudomonadota bacterium]